ncbi:hypothetical protein [Plastoroseomonas hellenica]|uniref:Uncharacterized protein n=1 Tax=Plastoroseomonas hellenica TaxID=2687306 RepID=A0ABS5EWN4_9PROT|nr:hypothetical protein [Plastoroseomonas hellenica]MBR0641244.1 hypothetical protein [Plastoroseomonas hellenica]MBR0664712.1 hypothetical protein [Plastoroseomonas hellenica]
MLRHYFAQRRQGGVNPLGAGTVALGSIFYIQDGGFWRDRYRGRPCLRRPWIVEAFLNGELQAARRDPTSGRWLSLFMGNRTDVARVRSLRDGRSVTIAIRILQLHEDAGLGAPDNRYPSLPHVPRQRPV